MVLASVFGIYVAAAESARSAITDSQSVKNFNRMSATALGGVATKQLRR